VSKAGGRMWKGGGKIKRRRKWGADGEEGRGSSKGKEIREGERRNIKDRGKCMEKRGTGAREEQKVCGNEGR